MRHQDSKCVFISGATSGIGQACAERFAGEGWALILTGRRAERLADLSAAYEGRGVAAHTLCFDVRDRQQAEAAWNSLPESRKRIDVLINNAGLALDLRPMNEGDPSDWDAMLDTNVKGLLYLTRLIAPGMVERGRGHIINIGSLAGHEVYPGGGVYCATKHAVGAISRGLRMDLVRHGIKVTTVSPGLAETEFSVVRFKGDEQRAGAVYEGFEPLHPEDVADAVWYAASRPPHVNIEELLIQCTAQADSRIVHRQP